MSDRILLRSVVHVLRATGVAVLHRIELVLAAVDATALGLRTWTG